MAALEAARVGKEGELGGELARLRDSLVEAQEKLTVRSDDESWRGMGGAVG